MTAVGSARVSLRLVALLAAGVLVLLAAGSAALGQQGMAPESLHLRVIAIHDFHGALRPTTYSWSDGRLIGGPAALKAIMDGFEAACACPTVRLDGGDQMQGTLESNLSNGEAVVAAFNRLGLDAAAVGNHELDWGVDTLLARMSEARYAWLAANVFRVETGERPIWARPYAIIDRAGVRVAVVGYATVSTPRTLRPGATRGYEFRSGYAAIRDALEAAWREEPDFVIVVAHAGGECSVRGCTGEMVDLAAELPPGIVHMIAGGHTHAPGEGVVNAIPIVRAGSNGRAVAVVDLYRLKNGTRACRTTQQTVYTADVVDDLRMSELLEPYLAAADAVGNALVTTLAEPLFASGTTDRRLGHLIADAARVVARADVGMHNPGAVRADLPAGPITYADLYRVMPFDNSVVRLTLSGRQLRQLVNQAGAEYYFSNLHLRYEPEATDAAPVISLTFADGTPVREEQSYTLATSDFLADGGDGFTMLIPLSRASLDISLRDAIVEHLRSLPAPLVLPTEQGTVPLLR